jgi:mRNA-degrading endonuclease HigB of HigAB toxin-antitoxin module
MHVITRKRLNEFANEHPETTAALARAMRYFTRHRLVEAFSAKGRVM